MIFQARFSPDWRCENSLEFDQYVRTFVMLDEESLTIADLETGIAYKSLEISHKEFLVSYLEKETAKIYYRFSPNLRLYIKGFGRIDFR